MKTELTAEQSQHLIDLGVPEEMASFCEQMFDDGYRKNPIFNLTDLLEMLPNYIYKHDGFRNRQYLRYIRWCGGWHEAYYYCSEVPFTLNPIIHSEELIDALYELVCWYYGEFLKSEKK